MSWKPEGICTCRTCGWNVEVRSSESKDYTWFCTNRSCERQLGEDRYDTEDEPDWVLWDRDGETATVVSHPRIYLAGPDVFLPNPKEHAKDLKKVCHEHRLDGVFPLDADLRLEELAPGAKARAIFKANVDLIHTCQGVLANMSPFRGPSMDVGTAWEVGFAYALGLPVVGYSNSDQLYPVRVKAYRKGFAILDESPFMDPEFVEDFGLNDNLMLDCSMVEVVQDFEAAAKRLSEYLRTKNA